MSTTTATRALGISAQALFRELKYTPHQGQRKIHRSTARHRVNDAGRRFGKSMMGGHELTLLAMQAYHQQAYLKDVGQQKRIWVVGPNYDDAEREFRVLWNDVKRLELPKDHPGSYYTAGQAGAHTLSLWENTFIVECRSADHPDSLDGEGLDFIILAEAAKMKRSVWTKYLRPSLADKRGGTLWNSTPEGKNYFYDAWQRGQDPKQTAWASWKHPSWVNDIIFPGGRNDPEILAMEEEMSAIKFQQEAGAEFSEYVGRVFGDWDEELHVQNISYDPKLPLYGAVDYGYTNPNVWLALQVDEWDNVYVIGEYYESGKDATDFADDMDRWPLARKAVAFYPDPASPGDTRILEKKLKVRAKGSTGGELKHRLEYIRRWLKPGPAHAPEEKQKPKLFVDRSCKNLIREFDSYRYPDDPGDDSDKKPREEPLKKDDHTPEALGRFFRGYYGAPGTDRKRGARVSRARVSHRS